VLLSQGGRYTQIQEVNLFPSASLVLANSFWVHPSALANPSSQAGISSTLEMYSDESADSFPNQDWSCGKYSVSHVDPEKSLPTPSARTFIHREEINEVPSSSTKEPYAAFSTVYFIGPRCEPFFAKVGELARV
jgi:hypothetical protein